jgi:peptide/nickel transport system substrate-binding protein
MHLGAHRSVNSLAVAAVLSVLLGATACAGGSSGASGQGTQDTSFTMAAFPTGNTMDPWKTQISQYVAQATYDTLTHLNADGTVAPWLATSWKYTDPKTLVMQLRSGVTFTDGTPFDAAAVVANIEYGKKATPSNFAAQAYLGAIASVQAVDATTVRMNLSPADPDLPYGFSQQAGWIVSPAALKLPDNLTLGAVGTGPYIFDKSATTANRSYVFTKNPKYWAANRWSRFNKLTVSLIADQTASDNAARSGQIDYEIVQPTTKISGWKTAVGSATALFGFTIFDTKGTIAKPLGDVRVRQAMNYAIDRKTIVAKILGGYGAVNASAPFGADSTGYTKSLDDTYTYDPAKAKALLAEAGYPKGFSLNVLNNPQWDQMAQTLAGYLRAVSINVKLSDHLSDLVQQVNSGKWAVAMSLQAVTGLPYTDVSSSMTPTASFNPLRNKDPKIDSLLTQGTNATGAQQQKAYGDLATYTAQQAWFVAPALTSQLHGYNPKVVKVVEPKRAGAPALYDLTPGQG